MTYHIEPKAVQVHTLAGSLVGNEAVMENNLISCS